MPLVLALVILVLHPLTAQRVRMITMVLHALIVTQMQLATVKVLVKVMAPVFALLVSSVVQALATHATPIVTIIPAACSAPMPPLATAMELVTPTLVPAPAIQVSLGQLATPVRTATMDRPVSRVPLLPVVFATASMVSATTESRVMARAPVLLLTPVLCATTHSSPT